MLQEVLLDSSIERGVSALGNTAKLTPIAVQWIWLILFLHAL